MSNYVFGPAMIPDKKIYRNANNAVREPHFVIFNTDTIKRIREKFHKNNFDNRVNINHDGIQVSGVRMTKSFLIDSENRSSLKDNFLDLPDGTWMIEYEIENEEIWNMIGEKKLNGFSVEGLFVYGDLLE